MPSLTGSRQQHVSISLALVLLGAVALVAFFTMPRQSADAQFINSPTYIYRGVTSGQSVSCSDPVSEWVAVKARLFDFVVMQQISGDFTAQCKYDYTRADFNRTDGCVGTATGRYYCEGRDPTHPTFSWFSAKCAGGTASAGGSLCVGGCNLPFRLSADATNYETTPVWLVNHGANSTQTLYPEGNSNTANYDIYLARASCESSAWSCSGLQPIAKDPWGNTCDSRPACAQNTTDCSGANLCSTNTGCSAGACYDNDDSCAFNADCNKGRIIGRLWIDQNANGAPDAGEQIIKSPSAGCASGTVVSDASIGYSGPASGAVAPNLCNMAESIPYYDTGLIPAGTYTVTANAPLNWIVTTPAVTTTVPAGGLASPHPWFGLKLSAPPVAVATASSVGSSGPFAKTVKIVYGQTVYFSSAGSNDPDGGSVTYDWDFTNDGTFDSTAANPTNVYQKADCGGADSCTITIRLHVTDDEGDTADAFVQTVINPPLQVNCQGTPPLAYLNQTVMWAAFTLGGVGGNTYSWTGTDGLSGITASVQKAYAAPGIKTATVTVTSGIEQKNATCQVEVRAFPIADATVSDALSGTFSKSVEVARFQPVYFSGTKDGNGDGKGSYDPDGSIVKYDWNFADGGTATGSEVSHTYGEIGEYHAVLTVTDNAGDVGTDTVLVQVTTKLSIACSVDPQEPSVGDIVRWDAQAFGGTGRYTYRWSFDDNDDGKTDVTYVATPTVLRVYDTAGKKTGTVRLISGDQIQTVTCSVTVKSSSAFRLFAPFGSLLGNLWGFMASAAQP